ncbi:MAG: hypothetical protein OEW75_12730 [Cyclobacteriaceae bacterium]|nr:hypothetical protein [Cyclobacteriaceae bacterium]
MRLGETQLKTALEKSINDFNNVRPHGKLGGLTPPASAGGGISRQKCAYFIQF